jgi:hypothetical protein
VHFPPLLVAMRGVDAARAGWGVMILLWAFPSFSSFGLARSLFSVPTGASTYMPSSSIFKAVGVLPRNGFSPPALWSPAHPLRWWGLTLDFAGPCPGTGISGMHPHRAS